MNEKFFFRQFFNGLAVGGAVAEWGLVCWLVGSPPAALHLIVLPLLAVVNRLAARPLEREPATGILAGRTGYVVLATAFGALASASAIGVLASVWSFAWLLGALSAEAGVVARVTESAFGPGFQAAAVATVGLVAAAVAHGYIAGYRRLVVTPVVVPLPGLSPALAGLRIAHVSDFHLGPLADRDALRAALDRVVALDPDVVCVTGDLVDSPAADLDAWMPELARLTARRGVFAILGNHDRHVGSERVAAALRRWTDWRLLRDEVATLEVDGARLHIVGLEDRPKGDASDAVRALAARVPAGEPAVLLTHKPTVFPQAVAAGLRLVLAGHTHGGQLAVPGVPRLNVARIMVGRLDAGTFARDGAVLHVNRGLGTSGQRVRIGVPCEISVVTLVPAAARAA